MTPRTPLPRFMTGLMAAIAFIASPTSADTLSDEDIANRIYWTNAAGVTFVTLWGINKWDYGKYDFHSKSEGWFEEDTYSGGADKLGHAYFSYVLTHGFAHLFNHWGMPHERAVNYGVASSLGLMTYMELGDGFSRYGFSYEDFIINGAGALLGYVTYRDKTLGEKIDFRVEDRTSLKEADVFNEYDKMKYLLAFKLNGFQTFRSSQLKYLELHLGYYTRKRNDSEEFNRTAYAGIGINLAEIFRQHRTTKPIAGIFNYLQMPKTYLHSDKHLD